MTPAYLRAFHTSDVELGRIAATAPPKLLIRYHILRMGATNNELLAGLRRSGIVGRTVIGEDLARY